MVLHLTALAVTVGLVLSVLLWVKGVYGASVLFSVALVVAIFVGSKWLQETIRHIDKTKRLGLKLAAFGVSMFIFSYAMVPLYHIICHGSTVIEAGVSNHPIEVDVIYERYRSIPVSVAISKSHLSLTSGSSELVYVTLENQSLKPINLKMTVASQPRTLKPYFGLVTPDKIELGPWQKTVFPVEVKFSADVPDNLWQAALLFLFQDLEGVGELGKTNAWKKMHGMHGHDGVK